MAASFGLLALIGLAAATAAFGRALADPTQEFGPLWNVVIALDVLNTVIVLYYLWRIWFRERAS
jgi:hypothetical protein